MPDSTIESSLPSSQHPIPAGAPAAGGTKAPRFWPAVLMLAAFWTYSFVSSDVEMLTFVRFFAKMAVSALLVLSYTVWWLTNRRIPRRDRWLAVAITIAGGVAAYFICDKSFGIFSLLTFGLACVLTAGTIWMIAATRLSFSRPRAGLAAVVLLTWASFGLIRTEGISGEQQAAMHWRWTPTAEERFLAERAQLRKSSAPAQSAGKVEGTGEMEPVELQPSDWADFRGPDRDGVVRGVEISTAWNASPPRQVWKQRVGPAWSSVIVVGGRLYTQEQRGESEAVVCLDAATGREIWSHEDQVRFWDAVAGAGPRATPAFHGGRIYALGAKGNLNCLDAASGKRIWARDIAVDSGANVPMWGFSSSPLVAEGVVIVFAGGQDGKGLLGYRADTGEPAWTVATGRDSYSSPQLASLGGELQVLFLGSTGLIAVDAASGKQLWEHSAPFAGAPISIQPHPLDDSRVLVASVADTGLALLDLSPSSGGWHAEKRWGTKSLQPSFNDFVVSQGCAFGFSEAIFACLDIETGKRRWKKGRYGHGQVLLLAEQNLLLVLAETGEAVLLEANPDEHLELARFQALEGKTWNHPAIAHGRLYVRNAEEMASFELPAP